MFASAIGVQLALAHHALPEYLLLSLRLLLLLCSCLHARIDIMHRHIRQLLYYVCVSLCVSALRLPELEYLCNANVKSNQIANSNNEMSLCVKIGISYFFLS